MKVYPAEVLIGQKVAFYEKRALFMDLCKESSAAENTRRNLSISGYGPAKKNAWTSPGSMASFDDALEVSIFPGNVFTSKVGTVYWFVVLPGGEYASKRNRHH